MRKWIAVLPLVIALGGCWNENVATNVRMGDVSIGQQMIDLKQALEEGAISEAEHARLRDALMNLSDLCGRRTED